MTSLMYFVFPPWSEAQLQPQYPYRAYRGVADSVESRNDSDCAQSLAQWLITSVPVASTPRYLQEGTRD